MLFWILSVVFLAFIALFVFLGVMRGRRYAWQYSAVRLGIVVVSALISAAAAALLGNLLGRLLTSFLMGVLPARAIELLESLPSAQGAVSAFAAMAIAPLIYYPIFLLIRGIASLFAPMIACALGGVQRETDEYGFKISKKQMLRTDKPQPLGMVLGGVCAFFMLIALVSPVTVYLNLANGIMQMAGGGSEGAASVAADITEAAAENVGTKAVRYLGGDALNSVMTTTRVSDKTSNLVRETRLVTSLGYAISSVRDSECDRAEAAESVRAVGDAFEKTRILPTVAAELLDKTSTAWSQGGEYAGISAPALGGMDGIAKPIYRSLRGSTYDTVKQDAHTIANVVASFVEADAIGGEPMGIFSNEEVTKNVIFELLSNERLAPTVGGVVDFGVSSLCDDLHVRHDTNGMYEEFASELDAITVGEGETALADATLAYEELFDEYALSDGKARAEEAAKADADGADMRAWVASELGISTEADIAARSALVTADELSIEEKKIVNKEEEAARLAAALRVVAELATQLQNDGADTVTVICELGPVLDAFSKTETVGEELTGKILTAILQSERISDNIGLNCLEATDIAETIKTGAHSGGYVAQMKTLGQTVDIISIASENGDTKAAVSEMLRDLTPDSAKTVQKVATPSVMLKNGVPEKSAKQTSAMVSDMLGNLSDAKTAGMSDEQLERETAAVNNVLSTAMSIDGSNESTFGENSATGVSASQFVDDIVDSDVVSQTVVDHVYTDGSAPKTDPLNSERSLSASDEAELIAALDAKWQNATAEQRADESFARKLVATASLMNLNVTVTANGVAKA